MGVVIGEDDGPAVGEDLAFDRVERLRVLGTPKSCSVTALRIEAMRVTSDAAVTSSVKCLGPAMPLVSVND